jgi:hypothetical protein
VFGIEESHFFNKSIDKSVLVVWVDKTLTLKPVLPMQRYRCDQTGYEGVDDYYKAHSSHEELACTSIPTLCIVSKDDFMLGTTASLYAEVRVKGVTLFTGRSVTDMI